MTWLVAFALEDAHTAWCSKQQGSACRPFMPAVRAVPALHGTPLCAPASAASDTRDCTALEVAQSRSVVIECPVPGLCLKRVMGWN